MRVGGVAAGKYAVFDRHIIALVSIVVFPGFSLWFPQFSGF
jgi:hypothetical protein